MNGTQRSWYITDLKFKVFDQTPTYIPTNTSKQFLLDSSRLSRKLPALWPSERYFRWKISAVPPVLLTEHNSSCGPFFASTIGKETLPPWNPSTWSGEHWWQGVGRLERGLALLCVIYKQEVLTPESPLRILHFPLCHCQLHLGDLMVSLFFAYVVSERAHVCRRHTICKQ